MDLDVLSNATLMMVCLFCRWYIGGVLLLSSICILYMYVLHDNGECKPLDEENKEDVETVVMKTLSILQRFSSSRSCSCRRGSSNLTSSFEAANLTSIRKRRAEEYRKKQIRQRTDLDVVLISPSNSPLQYPSHGFTVEPLRWTFIPGLAVNAHGREVYKVSLRVSHGMLAVEKVPEGQEVKGQNKNMLTITATSLDNLNDLLAKVTYSSVVYLLKAGDLGEAIHSRDVILTLPP